MNRGYADFMSEFLPVPRDRIAVIRPGLNLQGHAAAGRPRPRVDRPPTIGYLSRICPDKGLHLLVEAWRLLAVDAELPAVRLRAAGYLDPADRPYLDDLLRQAASAGLGDRCEFLGELDRPGKIAFLQSLGLLSVPSVCRESKGLAVLEAWANGVPAVLPDHGAFPEMVADTGGGLLFEPGDAASLAAAVKRMILDPQLAADCGRRAQEAVQRTLSCTADGRGNPGAVRKAARLSRRLAITSPFPAATGPIEEIGRRSRTNRTS